MRPRRALGLYVRCRFACAMMALLLGRGCCCGASEIRMPRTQRVNASFAKLLVLGLTITIGACAHDPAGEVGLSATDVPQKWDKPIPAEADIWPTPGWWRAFGSVELDSLIAAAQVQNLDLAAAA